MATAAAAGFFGAATWPASAAQDSNAASAACAAPATELAPYAGLPTGKLCCKCAAWPPRAPVVLVSAGSFNPPTYAHLRMCKVASDELARLGYDVWGVYLSPVADAYGKRGLAPARHRVAMCELASAESEVALVDGWEAGQQGYTRTLQVLRHVAAELRRLGFDVQGGGSGGGGSEEQEEQGRRGDGSGVGGSCDGGEGVAPPPLAPRKGTRPPGRVRVMLLCGADVLETMARPGVWVGLDELLREHGVVCVAREGTDIGPLLSGGGLPPLGSGGGENGAAAGDGDGGGLGSGAGRGGGGGGGGQAEQPLDVLRRHCGRIVVVRDPEPSTISSTLLRRELAAGRGAEGLTPPAVLRYARQHGLYGAMAADGAARDEGDVAGGGGGDGASDGRRGKGE